MILETGCSLRKIFFVYYGKIYITPFYSFLNVPKEDYKSLVMYPKACRQNREINKVRNSTKAVVSKVSELKTGFHIFNF